MSKKDLVQDSTINTVPTEYARIIRSQLTHFSSLDFLSADICWLFFFFGVVGLAAFLFPPPPRLNLDVRPVRLSATTVAISPGAEFFRVREVSCIPASQRSTTWLVGLASRPTSFSTSFRSRRREEAERFELFPFMLNGFDSFLLSTGISEIRKYTLRRSL